MANFFNPDNQDERYGTLKLPAGHSKEVGLWGGGLNGESLVISLDDENIVAIQKKRGGEGLQQELAFRVSSNRRIILTAKNRPGAKVYIRATLGEDGPAWDMMEVDVVGEPGMNSLFFLRQTEAAPAPAAADGGDPAVDTAARPADDRLPDAG
jgi:hypothetical protein